MSKSILLIPRIQIHNANALSSPYSVGFPAITAWLGAAHALERKLKHLSRFDDEFEELEFLGVAVVSHHFHLHTYRGQGDYISSIIGTGNPLDKSGKRPSFIEEARCDLTVSLLIEYETDDDDTLAESVNSLLQSHMKMAGGDIIRHGIPQCSEISDVTDHHALMGKVMPGYCLVERRDLMQHAMESGQDAIDALLDYLKITHRSEIDEKDKLIWNSHRKEKGWIIPIAAGFHGISELGIAEQQRDPDTPHRFAESIVTLGEFIMPYRIQRLENILWQYRTDRENNLYLCQQETPITALKEMTNG